MAAPILEIDAEHPNPRHLQRAVEILEAGGVVAYPTDTYYGLGCDISSKKGIERLYEIKGRDRKKPFSFLCHDLSHVADYGRVSNFAYRTMKHYTPGPFTRIPTPRCRVSSPAGSAVRSSPRPPPTGKEITSTTRA